MLLLSNALPNCVSDAGDGWVLESSGCCGERVYNCTIGACYYWSLSSKRRDSPRGNHKTTTKTKTNNNSSNNNIINNSNNSNDSNNNDNDNDNDNNNNNDNDNDNHNNNNNNHNDNDNDNDNDNHNHNHNNNNNNNNQRQQQQQQQQTFAHIGREATLGFHCCQMFCIVFNAFQMSCGNSAWSYRVLDLQLFSCKVMVSLTHMFGLRVGGRECFVVHAAPTHSFAACYFIDAFTAGMQATSAYHGACDIHRKRHCPTPVNQWRFICMFWLPPNVLLNFASDAGDGF